MPSVVLMSTGRPTPPVIVVTAFEGVVVDRSEGLKPLKYRLGSVDALLTVVVCAVVVVTAWSSLSRPAYDRMADFSVYLGSARTVWSGHSLYSYSAANGDPFTYPPFAVLPFLVLVKIPLLVSRLIWQSVCVGACALVASVLIRRWPVPVARPLRAGLLTMVGCW